MCCVGVAERRFVSVLGTYDVDLLIYLVLILRCWRQK